MSPTFKFSGSRIIQNRNKAARGRWIVNGLAVASLLAIFLTPARSQTESNPPAGASQTDTPAQTAATAEQAAPPPSTVTIDYEARVLEAYGAVLKAGNGAILPPGIQFADEDAVKTWQAGVPTEKATIGGIAIELQTPAMQALLAARAELQKIKLNLRPASRDAARRQYADTVRLWKKRVEAGLYYWYKKKKLPRKELRRIRALPHPNQAAEILRLEAEGLFFSTNLRKSILASAAPPGASQHLFMLALDVREHEKTKVRAALARHGWFQTVAGDFAHFTYLGCLEEDLPGLGLTKVAVEKRAFWVPAPAPKP